MLRSISIVLFSLFYAGLFAQQSSRLKVPEQPRTIEQWNLSSDFSEEAPITFDTVFSMYHRYRIADKYSLFNATLGNYGLPFYQINFFDRVTNPDMFLYSNYYPFMHIPEKALFMNTMVPFTELVWSFGAPRNLSEQTFKVRHSQNINRFLNFGFVYDIVFSLGQYNYQRAEDKNFSLYTSYRRERYKLYFSAGLNNIINYENGGISDSSYIDRVITKEIKTREVPVRLGSLDNAVTRLKNKNILLVQRYTLGAKQSSTNDSVPGKKSGFFGLSGTFSHIFLIETNKKSYSDSYPISGVYDSIYISSTSTFDSLYSRSIKNTIRFDFTTDESRKFRLGGGFGIRNELFRYSQIIPTHDTLLADTATWNNSSNAVVGRLYNNIGDKFRWIATGELYITGYRAGDFNLNGLISKSFDFKKGRGLLYFKGSVTNTQPSFWYQQWGSNHFEWNNNLNKEFRIDFSSGFSYPQRKMELKFNYAIIDSYTDFDLAALPAQNSGSLSVLAVLVSKDLRAWKFHLANDVLFQKTSSPDILDLPLVTLRSAGYFEHMFRFKSTNGKLYTQLGGEVTYNTLYHPYSYMPSTGRFYRQDQVSTGNYPFVNLFFNLKIQRTRLFIMFDHVNFGFNGNNFDMVPSYLMNIRMFRYGLAWTFYD
jgi:hypothetical protein